MMACPRTLEGFAKSNHIISEANIANPRSIWKFVIISMTEEGTVMESSERNFKVEEFECNGEKVAPLRILLRLN